MPNLIMKVTFNSKADRGVLARRFRAEARQNFSASGAEMCGPASTYACHAPAGFSGMTSRTSMEKVASTRSPGRGDAPEHSSEAVVGPYELQDFNLYYLSRFGYRPSKVAFLAHAAWGARKAGVWPDTVPESARREYDLATIRHWLEVFLKRFFQGSQFKRSAMPNGPKVGSGGSLSPRSDWRAPSDSPATVWLEELRANVPTGAGRRKRRAAAGGR